MIFLISFGLFSVLLVKPTSAQDQSADTRRVCGNLEAFVEGLVMMTTNGCRTVCQDSNGAVLASREADPLLCEIATTEPANSEYRIFQQLARQRVFETTALGTVSNTTQALYNSKPASGVEWFRYEVAKIQGKDTTFAQGLEPASTTTTAYRPGTGFDILQPMQGLWAWSRNMVYVVFIIIVIAIAFIILFRRTLGGQTPVTLFNSLPSLIISLILITFSYAISGLFIDVITVGTATVQNLMLSGPVAPGNAIWENDAVYQDIEDRTDADGDGITNETIDFRNQLQPDDPALSIWKIMRTSQFDLCYNEADGQPGSPGDEDCRYIELLPNYITENVQVVNVLLSSALDLGQGVFDGIGNILVQLILGISFLMVAIKLFMTLLNKYITLVLSPIFAPWYFFFGALPNRSGAMWGLYFRSHLSAALIFVGLYATFLLIIIIAEIDTYNSFQWIPPLLGYTDALVSESPSIIKSIIVFGIYLASPAIPKFIDGVLDVPDSNVFAQEIGRKLSEGAGGAGQLAGFGLRSIRGQQLAQQRRR